VGSLIKGRMVGSSVKSSMDDTNSVATQEASPGRFQRHNPVGLLVDPPRK